jgi:serine/threonine protein phosphatase PrpC
VWDVVDDQEAVNLVRSEKDTNIAARKLRDFAYLYGSDDNISVCVIYLNTKK